MKFTRIRSMRDIPTIQGMKNRAMPDNHEQIMSELSRLEHEKARIGREIEVWNSNEKKAQARLQGVQERVDLLNRLMAELNPPATSSLFDQDSERPSGDFHSVKLEY